jgi:hypothetical protein
LLGDWLESYMEYTEHSEAPDAFHRWTGIAVLAGALRRKVWINMGYFKWYPNFYITFVAPPGVVSKSTTADIGMRLLRQVEGIHFGPSSATWQALVSSLVASTELVPMAQGPLTIEMEMMPMSAMTIVASELGTFLDPDDRKSMDALVALWDCPEDFEKATKLDGSERIVNTWFQVLGCTTPSWIADNLNNYFIGGGFASRTIFIYSEVKRRLIAYPQKLLEQKQDNIKEKLIIDLNKVANMMGEYTLTPEAYAWGTDWYTKHYAVDNPLRRDPRFGGYFARKQTHFHKVAMVRAASLRDELFIYPSDMEWAAKQVTELESSMLRVFGEMNREEITKVQTQVLSFMRANGKTRKDALYRAFMHVFGIETFESAVNGLLAAGVLSLTSNGAQVLIELVEGLDEPGIGSIVAQQPAVQ